MKQYSISEVVNSFTDSGQKVVYIVKDNKGVMLAMKAFRNCTDRDIQEIEILKRLTALPGISKIVRVETYDNAPLLFEEYIDGPDLHDIQATYKGDENRIKLLIKNMAQIMKPIWEAKIIHRDLKPKNIKILKKDGNPIILDFGIARDLSAESITKTGDKQPMTWDYASPEQYAADKGSISYRTDFFALGLIGYNLFYEKHPFGSSQTEIEQKFQSNNNTLYLEDNGLKKFFEGTLVIDPSGRVRNVESLIALL